jgi:peptidyl-dipeptidase Dcp
LLRKKIKATKAGHEGQYLIGLQNTTTIIQNLSNRTTRNIQASWTQAQKNDDDTREVLETNG